MRPNIPTEPDLLAHARAMQFLRLIVSAIIEGLAGEIDSVTVIMADGETRMIGCRYAEMTRFLYSNGFTPIREVTARETATQRSYHDAEDFLENHLKDAFAREQGASFSEGAWAELKEEMIDSLRNETRALGAQAQLYARLSAFVSGRGENTLFGYLSRRAAVARDLLGLGHDSASLLLQIGAFSGHRTHPCAKTRLLAEGGCGPRKRPLSAGEFDDYAPEAAGDVALPVLAVYTDRVTVSLSRALAQDYTEYFAANFPDCYRRWSRSLAILVGDEAVKQFVPIPVHPLQVDAIRAQLAEPIAACDVLFPAGVNIVQRPTISLRTFTPVNHPTEPQIKTTLAMLMTNDVRIVSPARTFNAPVLSDLLRDVAERDPALRGRFRPLPETAAICWGREANPDSAEYMQGFHLGAIFRGNPAGLLSAGETPIPLNALLSASPAGGILLTEVMRESGVRSADKALPWFGSYAERVLTVIFGLLARYGIGLEAHQQNTDLVFDESGMLLALVYRDVSDIEIDESLLLARGFDIRPTLHPFIRNLCNGIERPLRQTMHATFISHLLPVIGVITDAFSLPAARLHAVLRDRIISVLDDVRHTLQEDGTSAAPLFEDAISTIERRMLRDSIETKCLLRKRAAPNQDVSFTTIDNPIAQL